MSSQVVTCSFRNRLPSAACTLALAACLACRADEPEPSEQQASEAAEEKKPVVDRKIESAVAAARQSAQGGGAKAGGQPAPPEDGVMDVEAAARELAAGAPAEVVFGGAGSEPRVLLTLDLGRAPAPPPARLEVSYRSGGSIMPTVEFELEPKRASLAPEAAEDFVTRFLIRNAGPAKAQPGRLPENAKAEIGKLVRSSIEFVTSARGAVKASRVDLVGNNPGLMPLLSGASDALSSVVMPYPEQPVGAGAFWMVKARETQNGAPVIAYRMVKVARVEGGVAELELATRRYLLTRVLPMESLPPHRVRQFESEGKASLSLRAGSAFPHRAEVEDTFTALVSPNDRPNQAAPVQSESTVRISFGG